LSTGQELMRMQNENHFPSNGSAAAESSDESESKTGSVDGTVDDLRQAAHEYQDRNGHHHPIAEFLYQLTKMLTDDNSEIIEWKDARIRVHYPERLEGEVLQKYFRHSKFASFQRQLNYFGFRKIAGKGKMSPCSYVNDSATSDIRSLLLIKRKTNGSAARKAAMQQRAASNPAAMPNVDLAGMQALASAAGGQGLHLLNGHAMALLQENFLRAGLGQIPLNQGGTLSSAHINQILALQRQHLLQQEYQNQLRSNQQAAAEHQAGQLQAQLAAFASQNAINASAAGQHAGLQAQLAAFASQNGINSNALNASGLHLAASLPAMASLKLAAAAAAQSRNDNANPASAALLAQNSSMPATAAMDAAAATAQNNANLFDSAANLRSLLNEHSQNFQNLSGNGAHDPHRAALSSMASQALMNRLPSSSTIFPDSSVLNLSNMLGSSQRLSSLLSLNSFSREQSLADLANAAVANNIGAHLAAAGNQAAAAAQQYTQAVADAKKFRHGNNNA
jgi:hypothetical protein